MREGHQFHRLILESSVVAIGLRVMNQPTTTPAAT